MSLYRFFPSRLQLRRDLLRSKRAIAIAEAIYQFERLSPHAKLSDLAPHEQIKYHDLAEHVIALLETP